MNQKMNIEFSGMDQRSPRNEEASFDQQHSPKGCKFARVKAQHPSAFLSTHTLPS